MTTQSIWLHELPNITAMTAPTGTHPNFVNPSNLRVEANVLLAICLTISVMAVGMRMWTQIRLIHKVFLDDWICCLALIIFLVYCGIAVVVTKCAFGVHQWNLMLKDLSEFLYWSHYAIIIYPLVIFLIKLAILLQCRRVFVPMNLRNATFWTCHGLIWLNFLFYSTIVFVAIFPCRPIRKCWNPWINGRCFALFTFATVTAAVNTASHLSILVLLQYVIWNLQMSLKKKLGVSTIFLVGILACIASAIRLYYSTKLADSKDFTYRSSIMSLWTVPEMTSGLLAMCLPVSLKFFQALKTSKLGSSLQSLIRRKSKTGLSLGVHSDERKTAESPAKAKSQSRKHRVQWDEVSNWNNGDSEQDMPNAHAMKEELSTNQILRITQIVTTSELDVTSTPNPESGALHNV